MGKRASVPFSLNARQATGVSNARGVWDGFAQHTHLSTPGHAFPHAEVRVPPNLFSALNPEEIAAPLERATFSTTTASTRRVTGRIAPC